MRPFDTHEILSDKGEFYFYPVYRFLKKAYGLDYAHRSLYSEIRGFTSFKGRVLRLSQRLDIYLEPGQALVNQRALANVTRIPRRTLARMLNRLRSDGLIIPIQQFGNSGTIYRLPEPLEIEYLRTLRHSHLRHLDSVLNADFYSEKSVDKKQVAPPLPHDLRHPENTESPPLEPDSGDSETWRAPPCAPESKENVIQGFKSAKNSKIENAGVASLPQNSRVDSSGSRSPQDASESITAPSGLEGPSEARGTPFGVVLNAIECAPSSGALDSENYAEFTLPEDPALQATLLRIRENQKTQRGESKP